VARRRRRLLRPACTSVTRTSGGSSSPAPPTGHRPRPGSAWPGRAGCRLHVIADHGVRYEAERTLVWVCIAEPT